MHYQFLQILVNTVFYWRTAPFVYVLAEYFSSVFTQEDTIVPVLEGNPLPEIPPIHIHSDAQLEAPQRAQTIFHLTFS